MANIIEQNENRERLLSRIGNWGSVILIMSGFFGCDKLDYGATFGWSFLVAGILLKIYTYIRKTDLAENGGILTKRVLTENDIVGLKKKDIKQLRARIYARHGYNFDVNDGLYYLKEIANQLFETQGVTKYNMDNIPYYSNQLGCSEHQLVMALQGCDELMDANIDEMIESRKNRLRENIERISSYIGGFGDAKIGYFNRHGVCEHDGQFYYHFKYYDWYKPTTNNLEDVIRNMSEIEKQNVKFLEQHEE